MKQRTIDKITTMIDFAETQNPLHPANNIFMEDKIGIDYKRGFEYCKSYDLGIILNEYLRDPEFYNNSSISCPLNSFRGEGPCEICYCCGGLYLKFMKSRTWTEFILNAQKMITYIENISEV